MANFRQRFQAIMDGTLSDPVPGTALGDLAKDLRRSGQRVELGTLVDDETPGPWRAVALAVVHMALDRGTWTDEPSVPKVTVQDVLELSKRPQGSQSPAHAQNVPGRRSRRSRRDDRRPTRSRS